MLRGSSFILLVARSRARARRLEDAIIHLSIAAEALLSTDSSNIGNKLAKRLSVLVAKNEAERAEIRDKMRSLYRLRSAIVHGGGKKPSPRDVSTFLAYMKRALERSLFLRHLSKKELVERLDHQKDR
jgi:hypothetical protein